MAVSLGLENAGKWVQLENGDRIWLLKILSKGAYSINLEFDKFYIPEGGELYIYNGDKTMLQGPITSIQNKVSGVYANDLLEGESIILEYYEPSSAKGKTQLNVSQVVHGYMDTFSSSCFGFDCSATCNQSSNDVKCPIGNNWQTESNGLALVLKGGGNRSTGFLVNNTNQDKKPYFLVTQHQIPDGDLETAVFRFHYKSPTCNGSNGPTTYFVTGADKKTEKTISDLKLLLLDENPLFSGNPVSYLGWSILAATPSATTVIHHPRMDVMKIATAGAASRYVKPSDGKNVWRFYFNDGITESGSSGSPTFDQNKRVIGLTHGAASSLTCSNYSTVYAYSGRLDAAWDVLCAYLDPTNSGAVTLNTMVSSPVSKTVPSISGPNTICTTNMTETLNNVPYTTTPITWSVTPASRFTPNSGTGTSATFRATNNNSGTGTITFTINRSCGPTTVSRNLNINISPVRMPQTTYPGPYATIYAEVDPVPGATSYEWYLNGQFQQISSYNHEFVVDNCDNYSTSVRAYTPACGWTGLTTIYFSVVCSGSFAVYPNPADDYLTIELTDSTAVSSSATDKLPSYGEVTNLQSFFLKNSINQTDASSFRIEVYNKDQKVVAKANSTNGKVVLDTRPYAKGTYFIHIYYKESVIQKQVMIE